MAGAAPGTRSEVPDRIERRPAASISPTAAASRQRPRRPSAAPPRCRPGALSHHPPGRHHHRPGALLGLLHVMRRDDDPGTASAASWIVSHRRARASGSKPEVARRGQQIRMVRERLRERRPAATPRGSAPTDLRERPQCGQQPVPVHAVPPNTSRANARSPRPSDSSTGRGPPGRHDAPTRSPRDSRLAEQPGALPAERPQQPSSILISGSSRPRSRRAGQRPHPGRPPGRRDERPRPARTPGHRHALRRGAMPPPGQRHDDDRVLQIRRHRLARLASARRRGAPAAPRRATRPAAGSPALRVTRGPHGTEPDGAGHRRGDLGGRPGRQRRPTSSTSTCPARSPHPGRWWKTARPRRPPPPARSATTGPRGSRVQPVAGSSSTSRAGPGSMAAMTPSSSACRRTGGPAGVRAPPRARSGQLLRHPSRAWGARRP